MTKQKTIGWTFKSDGPNFLSITGTLGNMSLITSLQGEYDSNHFLYNNVPTELIASTMRALEETLIYPQSKAQFAVELAARAERVAQKAQ